MTMASTSNKKKPPIEKKKSNVAGNKSIKNAYLNIFFNLLSTEQIIFFEKLYLEQKDKLERLKITSEDFMKYVRDSYSRYQEYKQIDAFQPMDKKGQKYVKNSLLKTIKESLNEIKGSQK